MVKCFAAIATSENPTTEAPMDHVKVLFRYNESDAGEYEIESLWALPHPNGYRLDNIPFYALGVAEGDIVTAQEGLDGELWYGDIVTPSGHSTIRLWFARADDVQGFRNELRALGCTSELSELARLVAVDVPPDVPYASVRARLEQGERDGSFEFEEACLGQIS
jgi:hypothetical protein